ncbi:type IV pili twitching motility protein PilT [Candidatus Campbellbacteria bacterium]|nr:MAG: type IV pili twitching motility protein PilT [Candidatus Campbellbacteria bacterium]
MENKYKKLIADLVAIIEKEKASDLHISEGRFPTIRIDGDLVPITLGQPLSAQDIDEIIRIFLQPELLEKFMKDKEYDFSWEFNGKRFRGNAFYQQEKISIVLRVINEEIKTLEELGLPEILEVFARKEQGFFLVVGPTGHGKSTTLSAIIEMINENRNSHILTIEDPVEYLYEQKKAIIDQREVKVDTKNFKNALKSMFRQDIDVVLVGEMRGSETIEAAVTAAETGHLVFSTLHTNSASQTIDRIIDTFPPEGQKQIRNQLSNSLLGIFSQRLIRSVSGGRVPAYELLINNNAVANLIREGRIAEIDSFIETSLDQGMISMNRSLVELVRKGEITVEDAQAHSPRQKALDRML